MPDMPPKTVLCIASYEKGSDFIRACERLGSRVILLTAAALEHAHWPRESIAEVFSMPHLRDADEMIRAVSYLARGRDIDRIVPLDEYDVQNAAALREHMQLPGMDATTARRFRDKLAMRVRAREYGVPVPDFVQVLNHDRVRHFTQRVSAPWLLKPRSEASAMGITRIESPEELWRFVEELGDRQSYFLLERYVPGNVYHADSLVVGGEVVFAEVHEYGRPLLDVYQGGGVFTSRTVPRGSEDERELRELNRRVLHALGAVHGVSHAEFIRGREDGRWYFLETAARVGGANVAEMVEAATGVNLWAEWAKIEIAQEEYPYRAPERREDHAGILISLARQEHPDTSTYRDPEIVWRMDKRHHAGLVVASREPDRVRYLLEEYSRRFREDFLAVLPPRGAAPAPTEL